MSKHSPVGVGLVYDPDLMLHVLSFQEAMNVRHKLHHFFEAIPERHYHCQLMPSPHLQLPVLPQTSPVQKLEQVVMSISTIIPLL